MKTYISLFSSAGIGCYGFKKAGFECIATNELIERRLQIQKYNNKCRYNTGYILGDITLPENKDKIFNEIIKWRTNFKIKDVDVVIATPPCQGMSVANHKKKNEEKRNSLIIESIFLVNKIKPRFFIFENVRAFLNTLCRDLNDNIISIREAIDNNLSNNYNITGKVINFKDYGSNSSRTRTLVIGVRKDILNVSPYDLFPREEKEKVLRDVIGKYKPLNDMGEISEEDIFHYFRSYNKKMLPWVKNTPEGKSAFDNVNPYYRPHSIKGGKIVSNVNKNGDKYTRCEWNKVMPCIHTRNDIFASQSTIHPRDNRVFSIRELMELMTIPRDFRWSKFTEKELNQLSVDEKIKFLKKEDINIRQSIGEAVPTIIFSKIAKNILFYDRENIEKEVSNIINKYSLTDMTNVKNFIVKTKDLLPLSYIQKTLETINVNKEKYSSFYTPPNISFSLINSLPDIKKDIIHILEPSVGIGNFIPLIAEKYYDKKVLIDVIDIDTDTLRLLKSLNLSQRYKNITIKYINEDFLLFNTDQRYDIVIGNPPFGKIEDKALLKKYKDNAFNKKTYNLFSFFIEHSLNFGDYVALITPKSLLSAPEYNSTRDLLEAKTTLLKIIDFGEEAFWNVKIETIAILLSSNKLKENNEVLIESYITKGKHLLSEKDIFDKDVSMWLIYKNDFFKKVKKSLNLDIFSVYRDRAITKKYTKSKGKYRVLKSRNIGNNKIINIEGYDTFIDNIDQFPIKKFVNSNAILVPNLSYNPRATFLPKNSITDGSVAILNSKKELIIKEEDLNYFATEEFRKFYLIGRNYGTRSLNIDTNSVRLWGIKRRTND